MDRVGVYTSAQSSLEADMDSSLDSSVPDYSVVVPVQNEAGNIEPLIAEIRARMANYKPYEIVYVDDGSDDETPGTLRRLASVSLELRVIRHRVPAGQSAAIMTGVQTAGAPTIITLDGDGQNDPADIPKLLGMFTDADDRDRLLVTGQRRKRQDSWIKRASSRVANRVRGALLGDGTPDTGCGLKVFSRQAYLDMPGFDHMHRFLPALMLLQGGRVVSVPVNHRPREREATKYGVWDRLWVGIVDMMGVMWLQRHAVMPPLDTDGESGIIDLLGVMWLKRRVSKPEIESEKEAGA